jgi:hypothetical protein
MAEDKATGRLRWASQRHPKGRPRKNTALSVFRRLSRASDHGRPASGEADIERTGQNFGGTLSPNGAEGGGDPNIPSHQQQQASSEGNSEDKVEEEKMEKRRIYFNMRLPPEEVRDDGTPVHHYPRNKIRTTKYTPLSFIPKNLYIQFHNVANIYFLFIIILQVSPILQ